MSGNSFVIENEGIEQTANTPYENESNMTIPVIHKPGRPVDSVQMAMKGGVEDKSTERLPAVPSSSDTMDNRAAVVNIDIAQTSPIIKSDRKKNICIGAVLSSMVGREYSDLIISADKALYYMKQIKKSGWYIFRNSDIKRDEKQNLSKHDLDQLINSIKRQSAYEGTYNVDYPEFIKIYDFIRNVGLRNHHDVQVILLTLCANDEKNTTVEERDKAMHYLEKAIDTSLRKVDIMMRFSSTQCIIFLMNLSDEQIQIVTNRIMNMFYKIYDNKNMLLSYDVADLNASSENTENQYIG